MIAEGYVGVQKHPAADLWIYNYTPRAQYGRVWNEATMACRGLILDAERRVVARPFRKFFNLGEHEGSLPVEPFDAFEKVDGSLGILYFVDGVPHIATRGSFLSEQSQRAPQMLRTKYPDATFDPGYTYLFEILYPENRIVVDYGGAEELVLLGKIETATGIEVPPFQLGDSRPFRSAHWHGMFDHPDQLEMGAGDNAEGFVLRFRESGLRLKVKFAEYVRLHRLVTGINARNIWDLLRSGQSFDELLDKVPDEYYRWVQQTTAELRNQYAAIESAAQAAFIDLGDRKLNAERYKQHTHPHLLFAMLDNKPYDEAIWKLLRPAQATPFKSEV